MQILTGQQKNIINDILSAKSPTQGEGYPIYITSKFPQNIDIAKFNTIYGFEFRWGHTIGTSWSHYLDRTRIVTIVWNNNGIVTKTEISRLCCFIDRGRNGKNFISTSPDIIKNVYDSLSIDIKSRTEPYFIIHESISEEQFTGNVNKLQIDDDINIGGNIDVDLGYKIKMNKSCPIFIGTGVKPNGFVCSECKKSIYSYNNNSVSEKIVICDDDIYGKTRFIVSDIATNIFEIANDKNLKYADVDDTDLCMRVMFGKYSKGWFVCKLTYNPYNDAELAFNTFKNKQHAWNFIDEDSRKILTIQHLKNTGYNPIFYDSNANNKIKYQ